MGRTIPTADEVERHFRSLPCTKKQLQFIDQVVFAEQYIIVDRGPKAVAAHKKYLMQRGKTADADNVKASARIGHCTKCHHEWILSDRWKITGTGKGICPYCHSHGILVSAKRGRKNKTLKSQVIFWETSKKDKTVLLAKSILAVRPMEGEYRTCRTITYPVTMYYFKPGQKAVMYRRDVWYDADNQQFTKYWHWFGYTQPGLDGIGSIWFQQRRISSLSTQYGNRGFDTEMDRDTLETIIQKTGYRYCQMDYFFLDYPWEGEPGPDVVMKYLALYSLHPQIEYLVKAGLEKIIEARLHGQSTKYAVSWNTRNPRKFLRFHLDKDDWQEIRDRVKEYDADDLQMLAFIQHRGPRQNVSLDDAIQFRKAVSLYQIEDSMMIPDIHHLMRYAEEQADKAGVSKYQVLHDYMDYLKELQYLQYDQKDKRNLWPKDFIKAHQHTSYLVTVLKEEEAIRRQEERHKGFEQQIQTRVQKLGRYTFSSGNLCIRPIASIREMITEGKTNHNCVATYIESYAKGCTDIFVIRRKDDPDTPYYTIEIKNGVIIQCRTRYNMNAPEESDVAQFIRLFQKVKLQAKDREVTA